MEEKGQGGYRTTFHMDQTSRAKAKGTVGPKGTAEGQTLLTVGAAGCTINRPNQALPLRPHQNSIKRSSRRLAIFWVLFNRLKSTRGRGARSPALNRVWAGQAHKSRPAGAKKNFPRPQGEKTPRPRAAKGKQ